MSSLHIDNNCSFTMSTNCEDTAIQFHNRIRIYALEHLWHHQCLSTSGQVELSNKPVLPTECYWLIGTTLANSSHSLSKFLLFIVLLFEWAPPFPSESLPFVHWETSIIRSVDDILVCGIQALPFFVFFFTECLHYLHRVSINQYTVNIFAIFVLVLS